jgi:hypothetical protein
MVEQLVPHVPPEALAELGAKYNEDQVIVLSHRNDGDIVTVASWGRSERDSELATYAANIYRTALNFPMEGCNLSPRGRILHLLSKNDFINCGFVVKHEEEHRCIFETPDGVFRLTYHIITHHTVINNLKVPGIAYSGPCKHLYQLITIFQALKGE